MPIRHYMMKQMYYLSHYNPFTRAYICFRMTHRPWESTNHLPILPAKRPNPTPTHSVHFHMTSCCFHTPPNTHIHMHTHTYHKPSPQPKGAGRGRGNIGQVWIHNQTIQRNLIWTFVLPLAFNIQPRGSRRVFVDVKPIPGCFQI